MSKSNLLIKLPAEVQEEIHTMAEREYLALLGRLAPLTMERRFEVLKTAYFNSIKSKKSEMWFMEMNYQEEIKELNEVIQRNAARKG